MPRLIVVELLVGLLALATALGFHSGWQASDRVFKPLAVISQPETVVASEPSPVEDDVVPDPLWPAPVADPPLQPAIAQPAQPVIGPRAATPVTAAPVTAAPVTVASLPPKDVADAGSLHAAPPVSAPEATPVQDGARHHVQVASYDSLQDALAVAVRLRSAGYSVSLSNEGPRYEVALATDFDTATAAHLVQVLQHAGFRAELIP